MFFLKVLIQIIEPKFLVVYNKILTELILLISLKMVRILVTGATGFIGSHLCLVLIEKVMKL